LKFSLLSAAAAVVICMAAQPAAANVLYDNGAPNAATDAFTINWGWAVSDSFTLTKSSTLTGVNLWVWNFPGDTTTSVDWGITPNANDFPDTATASVTSTSYIASNSWGYAINELNFALPNVHLGAGTYYLALQNAVVTNGDAVYWDQNNGLSDAWQNNGSGQLNPSNPNFGTPAGSQAFQVLGAVPEPATWAMTLAGFGVLGAAARTSRRKAVATAA
jgi:hypothetical protein